MATRPSSLFQWTEGRADQVQRPPASLQATGWADGESPSASECNWLFWQIRNTLDYLLTANGSTVLQTTLDASTRLVGGGTWTYNSSTRVLSWSAAANLAVPTLPLSANRLPAGSVTIPANSVVVVQANVPITLTGSVKSGSATVSNVSTAINIATGAAVSGAGIADGTTVVSVDQNTITLSKAATANNDSAALTFVTQGDLTASVYDIASVQPNANTVLIAFGMNDYAAIGVNSVQMSLRNGEAKTLMGLTGYTGMVCANAGVSLTARQALYVSNGSADGRNVSQVYPADASAANGATRAQFIGFASHDVAAGDCAALVSTGTMTGFSGLSPGLVYYLDPATPGAIIASRTTTTGQYAVPVGFAIDNNSLRINPEATRNLQPVTADSNIAGNLTVGGTFSVAGYSTLKNGEAQALSVNSLAAQNVTAQAAVAAASVSASGTISANSFVSADGFREQVSMGTCSVPANSTSGVDATVYHLDANGNVAPIQRSWAADKAGSVVAIKISAASASIIAAANSGSWTATLSDNGPLSSGSVDYNFVFNASGVAYVNISKTSYTFPANQRFVAKVKPNFSQSSRIVLFFDMAIQTNG